jgi:hypothetical protein
MSTAQLVRERVASSPVRHFLAAAEVPGTRRSVECELSRLVAAGELVRVRKGLYWKGPKTRVGMPVPRPFEVALAVASHGSGPAGLSAAHFLGLTTQVPAIETVAVPGRVPAPLPGVRFVSRSIERRIARLTVAEVALIEVLRAGPSVAERWAEVGHVVERLVAAGEVRLGAVDEQVRHEHHVATRERWAALGLAGSVAS